MRDYAFGRGSRATYKLPKTFRIGTCVVNLDMVRPEQIDFLTLSEVQQAALVLARQCVTGVLYKAGGIVAVGPRKVLYITMFGVAARGET